MRFEYPAAIEQDRAGFWLVTLPDLPETATHACTQDAALVEAVDCLAEAVAGWRKRSEDIPAPSPVDMGKFAVWVAV